uniref:NADH-ubiquinone oxidoreductase chain 6 n=1 Tax=Trichodes sinae TaxID=1850556 RepID=A0A1L2DYZ2_9CUCU|nr:NADH dehydrogenase subunit 6 [Trichodes sinae]ANG08445.1 NADH dehydrogenase subunit 6 [Trichodes sinae]
MKILILISIYCSFTIIFLSHPMSLGAILLIQTILISLIINFLNFNFWFSYILFLIMIGGMLILFIYMTSIASNEKFYFSNKLSLLLSTMLIMIIIMMILDSYYFNNLSNNMETMKLNNYINFNLSMSKFFSMPNQSLYYISIMYLLITLIAVVKISNINMGPLRPKN